MIKDNPAQNSESGELPGLASALHACLGVGVLVIGANRQVLCCTAEAHRQLGWSPKRPADLTIEDLPVPVEKLIREVLAHQQPVTDRLAVLSTERTAPTFRLTAIPCRTVEGGRQVIVTLSDVAVVRRIEHNLNRLDRLASIGTLSAGMAHEIRNAFVAVKTFVDLLLEKSRDAELAELVGREMSRIDAILVQMLKFGAPARPTFAAIRLHEVLEHSLRMLKHKFDGKLIAVNRHFAAPHDSILGDGYQLEQAFVNLLFNALEALGPNGTLAVSTETVKTDGPNPSMVRVTLTDNGIGIPPENMARLFEPFFTTKEYGTGLGLAIARRIIREHRGDISVTSEPNQGTTFQVLLPANSAK